MATLSITTTTAEDARLVVAFGSKLNLGRNATAAEIKADVIGYIKEVVVGAERAAFLATQSPQSINPT